MATDAELYHTHGLICSRITQIIETIILSSIVLKKLKSYIAEFDDDTGYNRINHNITNTMQSRCELDAYL